MTDAAPAIAFPTGPIKTPAPWGSFGVDWSAIARWSAEIAAAAEEFGVEPARIAAHMVIESAGNPKAVQKNDQNGWSYGLMQVVPRWHMDRIRRIAGRHLADEEEAGGAMLLDPLLAVRVGADVLKGDFEQHEDWDKASSAFFLGNPNWVGADTVNGNTGADYKRSLDGLMREVMTASMTETPPGSKTGHTGGAGDRIAAEAERLVGKRYAWGAAGPESFDCSGLVHYAVKQATGRSITRSSYEQARLGRAVERRDLRRGDVLLYDSEGNGTAGHVGIHTGDGRMVNALNEQAGVVESDPFSAYFAPIYLGARRLVEEAAVEQKPTPKPAPVPVPGRPTPKVYDIRVPADAARFGLTDAEVRALLSYKIPNRAGYTPRVIVWHIQEGNTPGSLDWWINGPNVSASASAMVQRDGSVLLVVPPEHGPWTNGDVKNPNAWGRRAAQLGGGDPNRVSLTIEAEGMAGQSLPAAQEEAILWLTEKWMGDYGIPASDVGPHAAINAVDRARCPGYWERLHPRLRTGGAPTPTPPTPSPLDALPLPEGVTEAWLRGRFGEHFDPAGPVTKLWLERGIATGEWPKLAVILTDGKRRDFLFDGGWTVASEGGKVRIVKGDAK